MDPVKLFIEKILYPIMEHRRENRVREYLSQMLSNQSKSPGQLRCMTGETLGKLLLECIENVPAYDEQKGREDAVARDPFEALSHFRVLTKAAFKQNPDSYLNSARHKSSMIANLTGGSTSEPVRFYMDRYAVEHYEAARWRGLSWWGITPGSRSVMVWGNPLEMNLNQLKKYRLKEKWLKNRAFIPAYDLNPEKIADHVRFVNSYRPEYIYGYASALHAFVTMMQKQNLKLSFVPRVVVSTSETLYPFQREAITAAFGCPVANEYGARDAGILAFECRHGNMHISCENVLLETLDPKTFKPVPSGQTGLLATTDLNNLSMPRLRYVLGDMAALSDEVCPCGMGLPLLKSIDGRQDDMFVTADGRFMHGHAFNHIARNLQSVARFQIIQLSPQNAVLSVVRNPDAASDDMETFIDGVRGLLPGTDIEIKFVDDIPPTPSGKYRYAIRRFEI